MDLYVNSGYSQSDVYHFICRDIKGRWGIRFYRNFLIHMQLILRRLMDLIIYTMRKGHSGVHGPGGKDVRGRPELLSGQWKQLWDFERGLRDDPAWREDFDEPELP